MNHHPAEVLVLNPENMEIANTYLEHGGDLTKTSEALDLSIEQLQVVLKKPEVKSYVDGVFNNLGFNNRFKLRKAMDALISKKFQELDEAGVGSSKDIADLLALSHKMSMEILDREIALAKATSGSVKSQVNVQINDGGGTNYGSLLEKLLKDAKN